jgi:hypothetical protein
VETNEGSSASDQEAKLAAKLPDPPTNEPAEEGQPEHKKLKSSHDTSDIAVPSLEAGATASEQPKARTETELKAKAEEEQQNPAKA